MILELLDRPIAFHRCFVTLTGSVTGAVLLSQAVYWQNRCDIKTHPDGFWWKTAEEWFEETGLSQRELQTARQHCQEFLLYDVRGLPAKGWYKVDFDALNAACKTRLAKTPNLLAKTPNCVGENAKLYGTETTPETTPEITVPPTPSLASASPEINALHRAYCDATKTELRLTPFFERQWYEALKVGILPECIKLVIQDRQRRIAKGIRNKECLLLRNIAGTESAIADVLQEAAAIRARLKSKQIDPGKAEVLRATGRSDQPPEKMPRVIGDVIDAMRKAIA